jgi:hypothetical protein
MNRTRPEQLSENLAAFFAPNKKISFIYKKWGQALCQ